MSSVFKVIRPLNLILILLTQFIFYFIILYPAFANTDISLKFANGHIFLLSFVTLLICTSGYLINDYFDFHLDSSIKSKVQLKSKIQYIYLYFGLFIVGLILSLYLANYIDRIEFVGIYLFSNFLLFIYSSWFKSTVLFGNIIVSLFTSGVILILLLAEYVAIGDLGYWDEMKRDELLSLFIFYAIFAFLVNLFREIVKDVEDSINDSRHGINTLATVFSLKTVKIVLIAILVLNLVAIMIWVFYSLEFRIGVLLFSVILLLLPYVLIFLKLCLARDRNDLKAISVLSKIYMFSGLLFIIIYKWI